MQGIVGVYQWTCTANGFANHAGTTAMDSRQDALAATARATLAVREEVRAEPGRRVGTVGHARVEPGAPDVIPGRVELPVELRDLDEAKALGIWARIKKRFGQNIEAAARAACYSAVDLPSDAGHDAQEIAHLTPIGMIFVPSRDGMSHSPQEYSSPVDAEAWDDGALRCDG